MSRTSSVLKELIRTGRLKEGIGRYYVYGTTLASSEIASSQLLREVIYPDSASGTDRVKHRYNRQGQVIETTDQNQTERAFDYDLLGRKTQDRVVTLGSGVDGAVRRIETAYNKRGDVERITSFDSAGSGNVVNEVFVLYNGFGQAIDTYQSHSGAVNLSTTPSVQMAYADGSANTIRPTAVTYPDGREVAFDYGAADSIHDQCSLVSSLIDSDTGETHLADYQYLGLGAVVLQDSPQADLRYTLVSLTGSTDPDTGDIYAGLDRFGRVKDLRWRNTDTGSDLSRVLYGYDRASSRIWRENPSDSSRRYDWLYGYDGLHRLHSAERGELNAGHTSITTRQFGQCWTLDPTGNWHGFRQDDDGNSTWDLIQARTSNPVNEITDIDNTTGSSWAVPSYDANGNMTLIPRPDLGTDKAMTATWDAWNRLAKLVDPDTSDTVAEFAYDGRNFRVVGKSFAGGTLDETRHFYFTDSWQCLEERLDSSSDPERQHVWGIRYIDDLVLRDRDTTGNGTLDERLYFLPDANWNVTAVVDDSGAVEERIEYTPYGWPQFLSPTFGARTVSSFDVRYTYTSREWDGAVGLYYFRNRWYGSTLGLFQSRDPLEYYGREPSLYSYVGGSATAYVDPLGFGRGWPKNCADALSRQGLNYAGDLARHLRKKINQYRNAGNRQDQTHFDRVRHECKQLEKLLQLLDEICCGPLTLEARKSLDNTRPIFDQVNRQCNDPNLRPPRQPVPSPHPVPNPQPAPDVEGPNPDIPFIVLPIVPELFPGLPKPKPTWPSFPRLPPAFIPAFPPLIMPFLDLNHGHPYLTDGHLIS